MSGAMAGRPAWPLLALIAAGCLSSPPGGQPSGGDDAASPPPADAGACGGWADASLPSAPDAVGNVLSLDFDEPSGAYTFRDRSGWRRDAARLTGDTTTGVHGSGLLSSATSFALVADDGFDLSRDITIAAWVRTDQDGPAAIFTDHDGVSAEYDLHIDANGRLVFLSTGPGGNQTVTSGPVVSTGADFTHLAVTWSDDVVSLYVNGSHVRSENFYEKPVLHGRAFRIGRRVDDGAVLVGAIDELRVWDRGLNSAEVAEFMNQGDVALRCGDRAVDPGEICEEGDPCCAACTRTTDGCGENGCDAYGVCATDCAAPTRGLLALYRFDEGEGMTVHDVSGVEPALDLAIEADMQFEWTADGLALLDAAAVSAGDADKIVGGIRASDEFTFDVWLTPDIQTSSELVRLVSLEEGGRDLLLGIWKTSFLARFAVDVSADGHPALESFDRVVVGQKTHLVVTRSADGTRRFYVDGVLRDQGRMSGALDWSTSRLVLGDAPSLDRPFVGTLHRVAVHSVALDAAEVAALFHAGPRP